MNEVMCLNYFRIGNAENSEKSLLVKKYLGAVAFNNITRLTFGKRFVNSDGVLDEQGLEFKAISENGLKLGATLAAAEHIPWLRWMFPLEEEAFAKHGARRDRLTRVIMDEHTATRQKSGGAVKQHFVDALLTLREKYDLSDDTIIGLLWVCMFTNKCLELFWEKKWHYFRFSNLGNFDNQMCGTTKLLITGFGYKTFCLMTYNRTYSIT